MFSGERFRYGVLAGLLLFTAPAFAQDQQAALPDPSYLPTEGHLITDTSVSFQRNSNLNLAEQLVEFNGSSYIVSWGPNDKYRSDLYSVGQAFQYGVTDDLVVGLSESCGYQSQNFNNYTYFGTSYTSEEKGGGCGDPTLTVIYRGLHQSELPDFPLNVDLAASVSPGLIKQSLDHPSTSQGGTTGDVNLALSHVFDDVTVLGRVGLSIQGKAVANADGETRDTSAYLRSYLQGLAQYRPVEDLFLMLGAEVVPSFDLKQSLRYYDFYFGGQYEDDTKTKVGYSTSPFFRASYVIIPDLLAASLTYQHTFGGDQKVYDAAYNFFAPGSPTEQYIHNAGDAVSLNFRVLWF